MLVFVAYTALTQMAPATARLASVNIDNVSGSWGHGTVCIITCCYTYILDRLIYVRLYLSSMERLHIGSCNV